MSSMVCPWWLCWTFDNAVRKMVHNPTTILSPFVHKGDTVMDIGCGMGYFSIPMAQMVGQQGKVIAVDIQDKMLSALIHRAEKRRVREQVSTNLASENSLNVKTQVDFALAFWMVHEVPDRERLLSEIYAALKKDKLFLIVEPIGHVTEKNFNRSITIAKSLGFEGLPGPRIFLSRTMLLKKA